MLEKQKSSWKRQLAEKDFMGEGYRGGLLEKRVMAGGRVYEEAL